MAARVVVVLLAVFLAGFGSIALRDHQDCQHQSARMIDAIVGSAKVPDQAVDEFLDACRGSHILALTASGLARHGKVAAAVRMSDEAIRREPANYEGWVALSTALGKRGLQQAAARASAQARRLNPRFGQAPG